MDNIVSTRKFKPFSIGIMHTRTITESLLCDDVTGRKITSAKTRDKLEGNCEDEEWTEEQTRAYGELEKAIYEFLAREIDKELDRLVEVEGGESREYRKERRMSKL